jgi:phage tail sheath gpL-like
MTGPTVRLTVPAATDYAVVARSAAASVASGVGATIEGVEDLRIIVSEAFALALLGLPADHDAATDAGIDLVLTADGATIEFALSAPSNGAADIDRGSFAWTILDALLEEAQAAIDPAADGHRLTISGRTRLHVPA